MKRNEAVEVIFKEIGKHLDPDLSADSCTKVAERVLAALEEVGMLPASYQFYSTCEYISAKQAAEYTNEELDGKFQWEEE